MQAHYKDKGQPASAGALFFNLNKIEKNTKTNYKFSADICSLPAYGCVQGQRN